MTSGQDQELLDWYGDVSTRRVDLVGDYAGNELFIVEGDSLLLRCFGNPDLDFDTGFQLLHAVYAVEAFLQNLRQRKCNFHIVFFNSHETLCIPPVTSPINRSKYLLARAVIQRHLRETLHLSPRSSIQLHCFESVTDPLFKEYLSATGVYFVMCHDGASTNDQPLIPGNGENDQNAELLFENVEFQKKVIFRSMILALLTEGYNVALINGLDWQDTKVMTEVVEGHRVAKVSSQLRKSSVSGDLDATNLSSNVFLDGFTELTINDDDVINYNTLESAVTSGRFTCKCNESWTAKSAQWTQRRYFIVLALKKVLGKTPVSQRLVTIFLQHVALLESLPIGQRRFDLSDASEDSTKLEPFFKIIISALLALLKDDNLSQKMNKGIVCDVSDLLDGRLLQVTLTNPAGGGVNGSEISPRLMELGGALCLISGIHVKGKLKDTHIHVDDKELANGTDAQQMTILPFSNSVFDSHLAPIQLATNPAKANRLESGKIFREVSHWHNAKRRLITKTVAPLSGKDKMRIARRNDNFMAEMQTYAASLTNATGKSLEPEIVTVGKTDMIGMHPEISKENGSTSKAGSRQMNTKAQKGKGGNKQKIMEEIAANKSAKDSDNADKGFSAWRIVRKDHEAEQSLVAKYHKIAKYFRNLTEQKRAIVGAEVQYHLVCILVDIYRVIRRGQDPTTMDSAESLGVRALVWDTMRRLSFLPGFTKTIATKVSEIVKALSLPEIEISIPTVDRKLSYDPGLVLPKPNSIINQIDSQRFQLLHCGPYMDRNLDSAPDTRVPFEPDGWQRKVLDELDANRSLFVVAPTSSGKTFISFYAMEKILRSNDESVLVYVAPTKPLVNQIAAEVQARFRKSYKHAGKSVWAIHTRDYRINNPTGCQVLVTVPHILQIMLLAPTNAKAWSSRVKYIIFDEIHSIGQAEDGVVWEQLLLLAPCPIIALSATVGNPENFSSWLSDIQKASGNELTTVQHTHRYSDLRKFIFHPPKNFEFTGLADRGSFGILGLDGIDGLAYMHPVASLVNKSRGIPPDLSLEARDCLLLFEAMNRHQTNRYPVDPSLSPENSIRPKVIRKVDIIQWETKLKVLLTQWLGDDNSPFDQVIDELSKSVDQAVVTQKELPGAEHNSKTENDSASKASLFNEDLYLTTLPLICKLHERNALPAIFFNYDRSRCEGICRVITRQLEAAETKWKESSSVWKTKLSGFETYKKEKAKLANKKAPKQTSKKKGQSEDDPKTDKLLDATSDDIDPFAGFDPEDPVDGYHFAAKHNAEAGELNKYFGQLRWRGLPEWLIIGLKRGIGVHHAGMNRKYRQIVEMLFRKGYLRVVFATGTLALGINMPCATVVFSGDSVFLTALNFRQAAGRAGRRGFDLLGNVVFQGISRGKICRLLSSRLPDLNGHFPITTTLILRLFTLLHDSDGSTYATRAINSLLSQPRLYLDGAAFKDQVLHHLRFSIEYLRRQDLLSASGAPINFAGLTSHLYFTENSSFALNALIKNGYFHELCADINTSESNVLRTLMLVLAHLFGRRPCRQADTEYLDRVKHSSSIVFLPPLPQKAVSVLRQHNEDTLQTFKTYVKTFVDQHMFGKTDSTLPLTGMEVGGSSKTIRLPESRPPTTIRSSFVALSGHGDDFLTISELCRTTRSGVFLEEAVIPYIDLHPEESKTPLNAYLYDFFMHGDIQTLEKANAVRKADVWFLLNDFSLVLATIVASLANFLKLPESDISLEDLAGEGDEHENLEDDKFADDSTVTSEATGTSVATTDTSRTSVSTSSVTSRPKKKKIADSWDVAADEEEADGVKEMEAIDEDDTSKEELEKGFLNIYKAMVKLRTEFDVKFRKIFA